MSFNYYQEFLGDDFKSQGSHVPYNVAEFSTQVHVREILVFLYTWSYILHIAECLDVFDLDYVLETLGCLVLCIYCLGVMLLGITRCIRGLSF